MNKLKQLWSNLRGSFVPFVISAPSIFRSGIMEDWNNDLS
ncbi:hypothetical protein BH09VER1_BH09VER1_06160 [soil metagenome]